MSIEDQQVISTSSSSSSILFEILNLIYIYLICCPTVISNRDYLVRWKSTVLIL
jgi:hypothetical protein